MLLAEKVQEVRMSRAERAQQLAADEAVKALGHQGNPTGHNQYTQNNHGNCDVITITNEPPTMRGSTGRGYLLARLKRDAPEIFARVEAGEFTSARAAAKAAGIVHEPTPLTQLHKYWRKVSDEDRLCFLLETLTPHERRVLSTGLFPEEP